MDSSSSAAANSMRQMFVPTFMSPVNKPELPLKVVINAKYIGTVIGHGGSTIREISKTTRAKCMVDVNNPTRDVNGNKENAVFITGSLENCSQACLKIMQIIQAELEKERGKNSDPVVLNIRVPNHLVGRLIGKGGSTLKKIMEETSTTISVSDLRNGLELYSLYSSDAAMFERVITIRADTIEAVSNAERKISSKLRNFNSNDFNIGFVPTFMSPVNKPELPLKVVINAKYIGTVIGHGGSTIREISKTTRAKCMVDVNNPTRDVNGNKENAVFITGSLENCSQACLKIMQIIQAELEKECEGNTKSLKITLKIRVPNQLIGRLIGKGGLTVKKIMEESGTSISVNNLRSGFELHPMYTDGSAFERVVIIRADTMEAVASAERKISSKLRNFYENDCNMEKSLSTGMGNLGAGLMNVSPFYIGWPDPLVGAPVFHHTAQQAFPTPLLKPAVVGDAGGGGGDATANGGAVFHNENCPAANTTSGANYCLSGSSSMASGPMHSTMYFQSPINGLFYQQKMTIMPHPIQLNQRVFVPKAH